jgi:predicted nucleotidyltransferase
METKKMNIESLKHYFAARKDISFAFLFGSQARGTATKLSDVDIAVYFYPEKRHPIEYEEAVFYPTEDEIWSDVERLLKREIEMLVMNRVSSCVAASAIRGVPLAINDWGLYLDFMLFITSLAEDFRLRIGHKCLTSSF